MVPYPRRGLILVASEALADVVDPAPTSYTPVVLLVPDDVSHDLRFLLLKSLGNSQPTVDLSDGFRKWMKGELPKSQSGTPEGLLESTPLVLDVTTYPYEIKYRPNAQAGSLHSCGYKLLEMRSYWLFGSEVNPVTRLATLVSSDEAVDLELVSQLPTAELDLGRSRLFRFLEQKLKSSLANKVILRQLCLKFQPTSDLGDAETAPNAVDSGAERVATIPQWLPSQLAKLHQSRDNLVTKMVAFFGVLKTGRKGDLPTEFKEFRSVSFEALERSEYHRRTFLKLAPPSDSAHCPLLCRLQKEELCVDKKRPDDVILFHGTEYHDAIKASKLLRPSTEGALGNCIYLTDNVHKAKDYSMPASRTGIDPQDGRTFTEFRIVVCRVRLGHCLQTLSNNRSLSPCGVDTRYALPGKSLLAHTEIGVFDSERVMPIYFWTLRGYK